MVAHQSHHGIQGDSMKNKNCDYKKSILIIGIIATFIGITFSYLDSNYLKEDKLVDKIIVDKLIEIANLDSTLYPPYPLKKQGKINDYYDDEKDYVISYYAKRMGYATKNKSEKIDVCSDIECYIISANDYKKILKTYEIEEYESNNIFKKGDLYYFIFDDFNIAEGEATHNITAKYGDTPQSIVLTDEITYSLFGLSNSKETYIYNFKIIENGSYSLRSIEKK